MLNECVNLCEVLYSSQFLNVTLKNWEWPGDKAMLLVDTPTSCIQWPDLYCRVERYSNFSSRFIDIR